MKKFLALMFVCAGLTAMAAPHVNKADLVKANVGQKVMKANTLSKQFTAPVMQQSKDMLTPLKVMQDHNMKLSDNRLARKAPRRISNEDVASMNYLDFRYVYNFDADGSLAFDYDHWDAYHFRGGEGYYFEVDGDQLYLAGLYFSQMTGSSYYLPLNIDYTTGQVELPAIGLLDDDTITGTAVSNTRVDTVDFSYLVDMNWYTGQTEEIGATYGKIYEDGTIEFTDPYVFEGYRALLTYKKSGFGGQWTLQSSDTTFFSEVYYQTQFIVPNANHDYDLQGQNGTQHYTEPAYMYQYDDTTAVVFNIYGMGMPGVEMNIYADGTMKFPLDYPISEMSPATRDYYANYYGSAYNWDNTKYYWPIALDENGNELEDTVIIGTVEPTALKWGGTEYYLPGIVRVADGAQMSLTSYPFLNNVIGFTDGSQFVFPAPQALRGDANNDGEVTIDDVTFLIDALLSGDLDVLGEGADCDLNGEITIDDVTSLIDFLLSNEWK